MTWTNYQATFSQHLKRVVRNSYHTLLGLRDAFLKTSRITLEKPVFIWGMGRSGTHLLFDIMSLHPSLMCLKTHARWKKGLWGDMHWGSDTPDQLKGQLIPVEGMQHFWTNAGLKFNLTGTLTRQSLTEDLIATVRQRYSDFHRDWLWGTSLRCRILDKTPTYILMLDAIDEVFPDAYHIFCIRDPRAVVNSILRIVRFPERKDATAGVTQSGFYGSMRPRGFEKYHNRPLVERLCWQVKTIMEIGFSSQQLLGKRLIEFKYETLLYDAHHSIADLVQRIELTPSVELSELIPDKFPNYSPPWPAGDGSVGEPYGPNRCYKDDEIEQFSILDDFVTRLGYDRYRLGVFAEESSSSVYPEMLNI